MEIADSVGDAVFINGYEPPPRRHSKAARHTGGGRGGREAARGPLPAANGEGISIFAFGVDQWDTNKVDTELKKRGLNGCRSRRGLQGFHEGSDGFDIQL
jgi:hypothetical protein